MCVTGGWRTLSTDQHLTLRVGLAGGPSFVLLERWELFDPYFSPRNRSKFLAKVRLRSTW